MKRLITLFAASLLALTIAYGSFYVGRIYGALDPLRTYEIPMCVTHSTQLRESPTGYVNANIPADATIWFRKLELPFAHVSYFDGKSWIDGTLTASILEVCASYGSSANFNNQTQAIHWLSSK